MEGSIRECPCCGDMILGRRKVLLNSDLNKETEDSKSNYTFNCPKCNLEWSWYDTDPRRIIINNYVNRYRTSMKGNPMPPSKEEVGDNPFDNIWYIIGFALLPVIFLFLLHVLAYLAYFCTFTLWDPTDTTWGYITGYSYWAFIVTGIIFVVMVCKYGWDRIQSSNKYKEKMKEYQEICSENEKFNESIKSEQLKKFNEVLSNKGFTPIEKEKFDKIIEDEQLKDVNDILSNIRNVPIDVL